MQHTQSISGLSSQKITWFEAKCRQGIFNAINKLENARIEIVEQGNITRLGNPNSELLGQMNVLDMSLYSDIVKGGSIAAAEAFINNKWTSPHLTSLIRVFARGQAVVDELERQANWPRRLQLKLLAWKNRNTESGSKRNILAHYDLGNELYTRFLDHSMMYSSAIYSQAEMSLAEAQEAKLAVICEKLDLKATDHMVEIGSGWGGLAIYAATHYGCKVTTTTISDEQYNYAIEKVKELGLESKITLLKKDYRLLQGKYDKLVSIEMIEAVGHDFMAEFFLKCSSLLKPDGKMLLQAITISDQRYDEYRKSIDFINKFVFPGGCLPSIAVISQHVAKSTDMMIDNVQDIGLHYARTLHDWRKNFDQQWTQIKAHGYDESFKRLWQYYLCYCEGAFIERVISTHHIVARKPRCKDVYDESLLSY